MKRACVWLVTVLVLLFSSCADDVPAFQQGGASGGSASRHTAAAHALYAGFPETFETGAKAAYAHGAAVLHTGAWELDGALIGATGSDHKTGAKALRIEKSGTVTMNFNCTAGASKVTIKHAIYGSDAASTWQLWYSANSGASWAQAGGTITTSSATLSTATFTISINGSVRFQLRKLGGGRLNVDDISITDNGGSGTVTSTSTESNGNGASGVVPTRDDNMALGNPSGATGDADNMDNYLVVKAQYTLSYNNTKGMANWVSWQLSTAWMGSATRCNCFSPDGALPRGYYRTTTAGYTGTGFDRGHLCPSDDRTASDTDNAHTFLMTNISPQAPNMNEMTWEALESYCRRLATNGNELYIIAGGYGNGGSGSKGGATGSIASGNIKVPARFWKIVVVLPAGTNDVMRVTGATRVIAVDMPNTQDVNAHTWDYYRTSVDAVEAATGYDFLNNIPAGIQRVIEARTDDGPAR